MNIAILDMKTWILISTTALLFSCSELDIPSQDKEATDCGAIKDTGLALSRYISGQPYLVTQNGIEKTDWLNSDFTCSWNCEESVGAYSINMLPLNNSAQYVWGPQGSTLEYRFISLQELIREDGVKMTIKETDQFISLSFTINGNRPSDVDGKWEFSWSH